MNRCPYCEVYFEVGKACPECGRTLLDIILDRRDPPLIDYRGGEYER